MEFVVESPVGKLVGKHVGNEGFRETIVKSRENEELSYCVRGGYGQVQ